MALVLLLPVGLGEYRAYQLALYLLYATAATGVGLCWGRAGFLPLGQAALFGLAAYLSGTALITLESSLWLFLLLPLAAAAVGGLAYLVGVLAFRRQGESGPYFSMITLALALLTFQVATNWNTVTGGFNGLKGIPALPGLDDFSASYYVSAAILIVVLSLASWLLASPLGLLWLALAQSERRVALFGFNTNQLKAIAFGIAGLFAGLGGVFYAPQQGLVTPQTTGFGLSADFVIWAAVGGRYSLLGPTLGTLLVGTLTAELRDRIGFWEVLMAAFFIVVVLGFPQGLSGPLFSVRRYLGRKQHQPPMHTAPPPIVPAGATQLRLANVSLRIGQVRILNELSFCVDRPGIFCIIGPNGAGKTSTFNLLTGEGAPQSGTVVLDADDVTGLATHLLARRGIARKLQIPTIFPGLTVAENLAVALWSTRASRWDLLRPSLKYWTTPVREELGRRFPFLTAGSRSATELSHGERQILELTMALLTEPRLLLLDEPCAGLSPQETAAIIDVIRWAGQRMGAAIIVIEHDMSLVKELAETVFVLHNGTLLAQGTVAEIQANPAVQAVYVGGHK